MAQINFRIDDKVKAEAEALFVSLGMNTTTALMIFIRQALSERAIPFPVRQVPPARAYADELTARIRDMETGRNCHVHDLIDVEAGAMPAAPGARRKSRRTHGAKALA